MTIITENDIKSISAILSKLNFVVWDRFTKSGNNIAVFGWIDRRQDTYKDFVVLRFTSSDIQSFTTSSLEYSTALAEILEFEHNDCERVEKFFKIRNKVVLNEKG